MKSTLILLLNIFVMTYTKEFANKLDRYLIACHSTDFQCFQRQYKYLKDHWLLGNDQLGIDLYEPYIFSYTSDTCVKVTGVEDSVLAAVSINSSMEMYTMALQMPIKIRQIKNTPKQTCAEPDLEFEDTEPQNDKSMKKFFGNVTMTVTYPYTLRQKKGKVHMLLDEETLNVVLDIPDHSDYDRESELETKLYEWSEWAYDMVQHVDVAQHCLVPFTGQLRKVMERLPIQKFLLLYPEEDYTDLQFSFNSDIVMQYEQ